ncbi:hypothetical protein ABW21_db0208242 [Orbilia brochopaga]|nr:hypothetical protein ABW21_db0208242 [Drechslerella brochopaga]
MRMNKQIPLQTALEILKHACGDDSERFQTLSVELERLEVGPVTVRSLETLTRQDALRIFGLYELFNIDFALSYNFPSAHLDTIDFCPPMRGVGALLRLKEFVHLHVAITWRQSHVIRRTLVDTILQEAIAIMRNITPLTGPAPNKSPAEGEICLVGEVDLEYEDESSKTVYTGKFDHGVGIFPSGERSNIDERYSSVKPYHSILAVVEAKENSGVAGARDRLLTYLGCIYRSRIRRERADATTYGIVTDGLEWEFWAVKHDGRVVSNDLLDIRSGGLVELVETIVSAIDDCQRLITTNSSSKEGEQQSSISDLLCRPTM